MALDPKKIIERYGKAKSNSDKWKNILQQAYNYSMPNRSEFAVQQYSPGSPRTEHIYDATAVVGLKKFAANLQNWMLPTSEHWANITPGPLSENAPGGIDQAKELCEKWEKVFFEKLWQSNFQNACYQSLMEMGISTGVLLVNEGTVDNPFEFSSIPLHQISLEPGPSDTIQNVYRSFKVQGDNILKTWPKAQLSSNLLRRIKTDPTAEIELIEGTFFDEEASKDKPYSYFVIDKESNSFLLCEYRSYSPWIVFRWNVYAGEVFGRGPIVDVLSFIKDLNKIVEFDLRAASFNANPIFLVADGGEINPYTARIEPGCMIPVQPNGMNSPPVQQLTINGQPNYSQLTKADLMQSINNALNVNPIVPEEQGNKTATEISARQGEWARENQASAGRFITEVNKPVFDICWAIGHRLGLWPVKKINGKHLKVEFNSPMMEISKENEIKKVMQASNYISEILGPKYGEYGIMYGLDITKIPDFVCNNLNVSVDVVKDALGKQQMLKSAGKLMQSQMNPQQGGDQANSAPQPNNQSIGNPMGGQ
jgi:hypothetical protein